MTQRASSDLRVFCGGHRVNPDDGACVRWTAGLCARSANVGSHECANGVTRLVNCDTQPRTTSCAYVIVDKAGAECVGF